MKSKVSLFATVFFFVCATVLYAASEDRIVAVVNDGVITLSELNSALERVMERIEKIPEEAKRNQVATQAREAVMGQLIDRTLLEQEASKLKLTVTGDEVDKALESLLADRGLTYEKLRETLAAEGADIAEYRDEIRRDLLRRKLIERTVKSKVSVADEEVGAYYAKHRNDYEGKEAVRIQQILIVKPRDATDRAIQKAKKEAEAILKKLKAGESFDLLVGMHSQGPAAKAGGDLGFMEKGMMFPAVDEAAFRMKTGEISDVIESPIGFHIIRIIDRRGAGIKPLEEVRQEIMGKIGSEKMKKKFEEWMEAVRKKAYIETRL